MIDETKTNTETPCFVAHEDAGGPCGELAAIEVYGLDFCSVHGEEVKLGAALEELHQVDRFLEQFSDPGTTSPVEKVLLAGLEHREDSQVSDGEYMDALIRAYAGAPEDVHERIARWERDEEPGYQGVVDSLLDTLATLHKLMRISCEERQTGLVELLERERESTASEAAVVLKREDQRLAEHEAARD